MEKVSSQKYFLVDNGSRSPESILYMRNVALELEKMTGFSVTSCGIMHSHKVDTSQLGGQPGVSMESFFVSNEAEFVKKLSFVPMFLGPSLAITDWLPEKLNEWSQNGENREFSIADCLFQNKDHRIARSLSEYVFDLIPQCSSQKPFVILVDHGTPLPDVNEVREKIGNILKEILGNQISGFSTACMERRKGTEYDFNDPLLETLLEQKKASGSSCVILAQLFLAPGRHAGPNGDISEICAPFINKGMEIARTPTLGNHQLIVEILAERLKEVMIE